MGERVPKSRKKRLPRRASGNYRPSRVALFREVSAIHFDSDPLLELSQMIYERFKNRPEWHRPQIWPLLLDEKRSEQRQWVSKALSYLEEDQRRKILGRLVKDEQFQATYNEIATLAIIMNSVSSISVDYEPVINDTNGVTPDLGFRSRDGTLIALVEVSSRFRSSVHRAAERQWREIRQRVHRIPSAFVVAATGPHGTAISPPDSGLTKQIEIGLRKWLLRTTTGMWSEHTVSGYRFQVVGKVPGLGTDLIVPSQTSWFNTDMIRSAISDKSSKYKEMADALECPLVVVLSSEPRSPLSLDLVRTALKGQQALTFSFNPLTVGHLASVKMRMNERDSPLNFDPALSAIGWLQPEIDTPGKLTLFSMADAARKINAPHGISISDNSALSLEDL